MLCIQEIYVLEDFAESLFQHERDSFLASVNCQAQYLQKLSASIVLTRPNKQNKQQGSSSASYQRFLQTATALPILSCPKSLLSQARYSRLLPVRLPGANIQQEQPDGLDSVKSSNLTLEGALQKFKGIHRNSSITQRLVSQSHSWGGLSAM